MSHRASTASDTIRLFASPPPSTSSAPHPENPSAAPLLISVSPERRVSTPNSSAVSVEPDHQNMNNTSSPKIPDSSDMRFDMGCVFDAKNLKTKQFKQHFRGVQWIVEFYKTAPSAVLGCRIYCNRKNKSPMWSLSATICRTMMLPASLPGSEKYEEFEFDAKNTCHELPASGHWTCLMDFNFKIFITRVVGIPLRTIVDFTRPKENVFDGVLVIGGEKLYVGKAFLAMYSPYFEALFFSQFAEANLSEIPIAGDVDYDDFIEFLTYIYPNERFITSFNVAMLLKYSDRFDVPNLTEKCEKWLTEDDIMDRALKLLLAEQYRLSKLQHHVLSALKTQRQIKKLSKSKSYHELSDASKAAIFQRMLDLVNDENSSDGSLSSDGRDISDEEEDERMSIADHEPLRDDRVNDRRWEFQDVDIAFSGSDDSIDDRDSIIAYSDGADDERMDQNLSNDVIVVDDY